MDIDTAGAKRTHATHSIRVFTLQHLLENTLSKTFHP